MQLRLCRAGRSVNPSYKGSQLQFSTVHQKPGPPCSTKRFFSNFQSKEKNVSAEEALRKFRAFEKKQQLNKWVETNRIKEDFQSYVRFHNTDVAKYEKIILGSLFKTAIPFATRLELIQFCKYNNFQLEDLGVYGQDTQQKETEDNINSQFNFNFSTDDKLNGDHIKQTRGQIAQHQSRRAGNVLHLVDKSGRGKTRRICQLAVPGVAHKLYARVSERGFYRRHISSWSGAWYVVPLSTLEIQNDVEQIFPGKYLHQEDKDRVEGLYTLRLFSQLYLLYNALQSHNKTTESLDPMIINRWFSNGATPLTNNLMKELLPELDRSEGQQQNFKLFCHVLCDLIQEASPRREEKWNIMILLDEAQVLLDVLKDKIEYSVETENKRVERKLGSYFAIPARVHGSLSHVKNLYMCITGTSLSLLDVRQYISATMKRELGALELPLLQHNQFTSTRLNPREQAREDTNLKGLREDTITQLTQQLNFDNCDLKDCVDDIARMFSGVPRYTSTLIVNVWNFMQQRYTAMNHEHPQMSAEDKEDLLLEMSWQTAAQIGEVVEAKLFKQLKERIEGHFPDIDYDVLCRKLHALYITGRVEVNPKEAAVLLGAGLAGSMANIKDTNQHHLFAHTPLLARPIFEDFVRRLRVLQGKLEAALKSSVQESKSEGNNKIIEIEEEIKHFYDQIEPMFGEYVRNKLTNNHGPLEGQGYEKFMAILFTMMTKGDSLRDNPLFSKLPEGFKYRLPSDLGFYFAPPTQSNDCDLLPLLWDPLQRYPVVLVPHNAYKGPDLIAYLELPQEDLLAPPRYLSMLSGQLKLRTNHPISNTPAQLSRQQRDIEKAIESCNPIHLFEPTPTNAQFQNVFTPSTTAVAADDKKDWLVQPGPWKTRGSQEYVKRAVSRLHKTTYNPGSPIQFPNTVCFLSYFDTTEADLKSAYGKDAQGRGYDDLVVEHITRKRMDYVYLEPQKIMKMAYKCGLFPHLPEFAKGKKSTR